MNVRYLAMLTTGMLMAGNALANDGETLARTHHCLECHALDGKSTGPSFREISNRYKGNRDAQTLLERKIRSGSNGAWGKLPMPASAKSLSDSDIRLIAKWMLAL